MKTQDIRGFMKTLQDLINISGGSSPEVEPIRAPIQEQAETEPEEGREGRKEVSSITLRNEILILGGGIVFVVETFKCIALLKPCGLCGCFLMMIMAPIFDAANLGVLIWGTFVIFGKS